MHTPFRVGLDVSALSPDFKEHALRGIGRYVFELQRFFGRRTHDALTVTPFRHEDFAPPKAIDALIGKLPYGRQTVRQQFLFPLRMSAKTKSRFDILHFPAHMDAPSWSMRDYVITVLDLIPLVLADLYRSDKASWRFHLARSLEIRAIKNAKHIIAISEHTAKDVHRILGIPADRISVTPLGVDESFFTQNRVESRDIRDRYAIPNGAPIVLYVGGIDQRKNITGLIRSFQRVVEEVGASGRTLPRLMLVGKIDRDRQYPKLRSLIDDAKLGDLVIETGFASEADLRSIYAEAAVFFLSESLRGVRTAAAGGDGERRAGRELQHLIAPGGARRRCSRGFSR